MSETLAALGEFVRCGQPSSRRISFEFPESILNLYLRFSLATKPRPGLRSLRVVVLPDNRIDVVAEIDFDQLRAAAEGLTSEFRGIREVHAQVRFRVQQNAVTLHLTPGFGGVKMSSGDLGSTLRALASIQPEHIDTNRPVPMPLGLRSLYTRGQLLGGATEGPPSITTRMISRPAPMRNPRGRSDARPRPVQCMAAYPYEGFVDYAGCDRVHGWVWDKTNPTSRLDVSVRSAENLEEMAKIGAIAYRHDLAMAGKGDGRHAFTFTISPDMKDGNPRDIRLFVGGSSFELMNSPVRLTCSVNTPHYEGYIDVQRCRVISGWAADRTNLSRTVSVDVFEGRRRIAQVRADDPRDDLREYLGDHGAHGFHFDVPGWMMNPQPHTLRLMYSGTREPLGNSPVILTGCVTGRDGE